VNSLAMPAAHLPELTRPAPACFNLPMVAQYFSTKSAKSRWRCQVIPLHLPPLRLRRSDIPLLLDHFLERVNRKYNLTAKLSSNASIYLWEYDWPGNVRELENVVERMVLPCENGEIGLTDLPANICSFVSEKKCPQATLSSGELDFRSATKQFELRLIDEAMQLADGNKAMAARMLKLKRTALVAKLRGRWRGKDDHELHSQSAVETVNAHFQHHAGRRQ